MSKKKTAATETDGVYFLKLLMYLVLGSIWIKYNGYVVFPIGLLIGLLFARSDHFSIDKKVEYAVLLIAALVGLTTWGVYLAF